MEESNGKEVMDGGALTGFSPNSTTRISWKSRRRSASGRNLDKVTDDSANGTPDRQEQSHTDDKMEEANLGVELSERRQEQSHTDDKMEEANLGVELSERRKALFEPLEPAFNINGKRPSADSLLPPPDFDSASYPKGWLIGKKRKLVNVDVVESMRRIAVQEMNRKDREIDGLNEQLEEDARCMEHLQVQLLQEKSKRAEAERENSGLKEQISMLMSMLEENDAMANDDNEEEDPGQP